MRRVGLVALALVAVALALAAGCGGGGGGKETAATTAAGTAGGMPAGDAANGAKIFAAQGCGGCHTLQAAGASGTVGPNLDQAKPSFDLVVQRVANGKGAMPSFAGKLSEQEIRDVAAYVSSSAGG